MEKVQDGKCFLIVYYCILMLVFLHTNYIIIVSFRALNKQHEFVTGRL